MKYVTIKELSDTIRKELWKVPRDIDFIIAIPRSGMLAASIICGYLNVPLIDINSYMVGMDPYGGNRLKYFNQNHRKTSKALVVDDTVYNGNSMRNTKEKLRNRKDIEYVYMCVFLEGKGADSVDIYMSDLRKYTNDKYPIVLYEWNIFQHNESHTSKFLYDMDGVLCVDPPDERNETEYIKYIKDAKPLFIPRSRIGGIVTYRLEKNREITKSWLDKYGINYDKLIMSDAKSHEDRRKSKPPEEYKAAYYKNSMYELFIESNDRQARRIRDISGKPVFCTETNTIYQ